MRIALVTESFLPDVNGVANSVVRAAEHLLRRGHEPLVIAPQPPPGKRRAASDLPYPVIRIPSFPMPGYPSIRLGLPTPALTGTMRAYGTELVHLASPFVLGAWGAAAARTLKLPCVAVYQTYGGNGWAQYGGTSCRASRCTRPTWPRTPARTR